MYAAQPSSDGMSEVEYLAFADEQLEKYEYRDGFVYAMTGGSIRHNAITVGVSTHLSNLLEDSDCFVLSADARVHIAAKAAYRYPDVVVFCGEPGYVNNRVDTIANPALLVEVLSPSTALIDYSEKLTEYTAIDTLAAYLLVAQDTIQIDSYVRQESGEFVYQSVAGLEGDIQLPSLGIRLALPRIYNRIEQLKQNPI